MEAFTGSWSATHSAWLAMAIDGPSSAELAEDVAININKQAQLGAYLRTTN
jgi:hypothetical protein